MSKSSTLTLWILRVDVFIFHKYLKLGAPESEYPQLTKKMEFSKQSLERGYGRKFPSLSSEAGRHEEFSRQSLLFSKPFLEGSYLPENTSLWWAIVIEEFHSICACFCCFFPQIHNSNSYFSYLISTPFSTIPVLSRSWERERFTHLRCLTHVFRSMCDSSRTIIFIDLSINFCSFLLSIWETSL